MNRIFGDKITAKTFNQAIMTIAVIIWLAIYAYIVSSKSSPYADDYQQKLQTQAREINNKIALAKQSDASAVELMQLNQLQCQIKLCLKEPSLQTVYLPALIESSPSSASNDSLVNINTFSGNIYRDSGQYETAKDYYQKSIAFLSTNQPIADYSPSNHAIVQNDIARCLNNIGVLYYLLAKGSSANTDKKENYLLAQQYFNQAALRNQSCNNKCLSQTINMNRQVCSAERSFLSGSNRSLYPAY